MSELNFLLSNYSFGEVLILLIVIIFLGISLLKAWDFIWDKIKGYFNLKNTKEQENEQILKKIDLILNQIRDVSSNVQTLEEYNEQHHKRLKKLETYMEKDKELDEEIIAHNNKIDQMCSTVTERLQQDARWAFKDAYNYYYKKLGYIDSQSLEALESKYQYYIGAGGNSFVIQLMEKIRTLPIEEYDVNKS